jgi:hypothetical protein
MIARTSFTDRLAPRLCVVALLISIASACDERAIVVLPIIRDSAGVRVVEYSDAALPLTPAWTIGTAPLVDVGGNEADSANQFFRIRSVAALPGGSFLVANASTSEIRIYDRTGRRVGSVGRHGAGPGEFDLLGWATVGAGDSIVAYDPQQQRVSVFGREGGAPRTFSLDLPSLRFPFARQRLSDGSILVTSEDVFTPASAKGVHRELLVLQRVSSTGRSRGEFLRLPGDDKYVLPEKGGVRVTPLAFGRAVVLSAGDSTLYVGGTDEYNIRGFTLAGTTRLILRVSRKPRAVTADVIAAFSRRELSRIEGQHWRSFFTAMYDSMTYPATMPQFSALRVDDHERLWVRDYPLHPDSTPIWRVFDSTGAALGTVTMPASFDLHSIAGDRVFGVWRDGDDIEHVRVYALRRPE